MKAILTFILATFILCSCEKYPQYEYEVRKILPDSVKASKLKFIIETMRATDYRLTTSDYEDPEDVVRECGRQFNWTYEIAIEGLRIESSHNNGHFIPYNALDSNQRKIFNCLKAGGQECY